MRRSLRIKIEDLRGYQLEAKPQGVSGRRALGAHTFRGVTKQNELFEQKLAFQILAADLPPPERQVLFASGRKFAADFAWREFMLLAEVQGGIWKQGGGGHSHPMHILRDIEKAQLAVINGWSMFPVTTDQVTSGEALQLIELALRAKGWKR